MKQQVFRISLLAFLVVALMTGCGPSEKAVATAIAQTEEVERAIEQQTHTAEAMILEQTEIAQQRAKETEQAQFAAETEQARIAQETQQAVVAQTQTAEAVSYAQTQTAIPRQCTPGGVFVDFEGDASEDLVDILKVETFLEGENLTVVMFVKSLPPEITINKEEKGHGEIEWAVNIDVDNDPETGSSKNYDVGKGLEYTLRLFHFSWGEEKTGPIEQVMARDTSVWRFTEEGTTSVSSGSMSVDYEANSVTIKGRVPGINEESRLYFTTSLTFTDVDTLCE